MQFQHVLRILFQLIVWMCCPPYGQSPRAQKKASPGNGIRCNYGAGSFRLQFQMRTPSAHQTRKRTILAGTQTSCSQM